MGIGIVYWDWALELEIRIGNWGLRLGIGDWDHESGLGIGIGNWDFGLGLGLGIRIGNLDLGLGFGNGIVDWDC